MRAIAPVKESRAASGEDADRLLTGLRALQHACEAYDDAAAEYVLAKFDEGVWTKETLGFLSELKGRLLHSDYDEMYQLIADHLDKG
jgi:hypothetical protein